MTVQELIEKLSAIPGDATIMLKHQLVGDEHYAESVVYEKNDYRNKSHGVVWICEINE